MLEFSGQWVECLVFTGWVNMWRRKRAGHLLYVMVGGGLVFRYWQMVWGAADIKTENQAQRLGYVMMN